MSLMPRIDWIAVWSRENRYQSMSPGAERLPPTSNALRSESSRFPRGWASANVSLFSRPLTPPDVVATVPVNVPINPEPLLPGSSAESSVALNSFRRLMDWINWLAVVVAG